MHFAQQLRVMPHCLRRVEDDYSSATVRGIDKFGNIVQCPPVDVRSRVDYDHSLLQIVRFEIERPVGERGSTRRSS